MKIGYVFKLRESIEFFPGEHLRVFHQPADFEAPIFQCDFWFDAEIENREALGEMLARRKAIAGARSEPDGRISGLDKRFCEAVGRFRFAGHFARPTFLAINQARVRRRHDRNFNRGSCGLRGFSTDNNTTRLRDNKTGQGVTTTSFACGEKAALLECGGKRSATPLSLAKMLA